MKFQNAESLKFENTFAFALTKFLKVHHFVHIFGDIQQKYDTPEITQSSEVHYLFQIFNFSEVFRSLNISGLFLYFEVFEESTIIQNCQQSW